MPPLRARLDDLTLLVAAFLDAFGHGAGITDAALEVLRRHPWPGNVRELRNSLAHAATVARGGPIAPGHLPESAKDGRPRRRRRSTKG